MRKAVLAFLGIWLIIGHTCDVKADLGESLSYKKLTPIELGLQGSTASLLFNNTETENCPDFSEAILTETSDITLSPSQLSLGFGNAMDFVFTMALGLFFFPRNEEIVTQLSVSQNFSTPLYLQLQRLQVYMK